MKRAARFLAMLLTVVLLVSCLTGLSMAAKKTTAETKPQLENKKGFQSATFRKTNTYQYGDEELVRAILVLDGDAAATANSATRAAAISRLNKQHGALRETLRSKKIAYTELFDYTNVLNGMAIEVAYGTLDTIAAMDGVSAVYIANSYSIPEPVKNETRTANANMTTGVNFLHESGYDGSGIVVAVLDSGVTPDHEAFDVYDGMLQNAAISQTQAETTISALGRGTYLSQKIPYAYDYGDRDIDATDDGAATEGHGTHVSGIAVGYAEAPDGAVTFSGAAPDAQLLAMKIFGTESSTTSSDIYFAALDDAYALGADIINMSIGSQNGFTYDSELETEVFGNIYQKLEELGIMVIVAAGNDFSQAEYASTFAGSGYLTAGYTDYGTVGSPSTYSGNLSVASVENMAYPAYVLQVDAIRIAYNDSSDDHAFVKEMGGKEYAFVAVPNNGESEDYTGIDAAGKVALISRGVITFEDKVKYAAEAGAVAAIIYNNEAGVIGMQIDTYAIPAVSITQQDGGKLLDYLEVTPPEEQVKMSFSEELVQVENPDGLRLSDFSSWGCANDLTLKPQLSGIGGQVYSVANNSTDGYKLMSGTSMASPDVAGNLAAAMEKLRGQYPDLDRAQLAAMLEARAQSTARILSDEQDYPYSPRIQGSGIIDTSVLCSTPTYITKPICNLYDDPEKTGVFDISFTVKNDSDTDWQYYLDTTVLYDYLLTVNAGTQEEPDYLTYNTITAEKMSLGNDYIISTNSGGVITVPANNTLKVSLQIVLSPGMKKELDEKFPNGTFVEGFVKLEPLSTNVYTLHATFLGYYGDWAAAPVFESYDWRDIVTAHNWVNNTSADPDGNTYADYGYTYLDVVDFEIDTDVSAAYLVGEMEYDSFVVYAGDNPYAVVEDYSDKRIAVSNGAADGALLADSLYAEPITLRNTRHLIMVVTDAQTGEIYTVDDTEYVPKTAYDTEHGYWAPQSSFVFNGTKTYGVQEPVPLPNNTKVNIDYYANLAIGDDILGDIAYEDLLTLGADFKVWSYPCTVDNTKPVFDLESMAYNKEAGTVTISVGDNQYLAYVSACDMEGNELDSVSFCDTEPGQAHEVVLHVGTSAAKIRLYADDYATNENYADMILQKIPATVTFSFPEGMTLIGDKTVATNIGESITMPDLEGTAPTGYSFAAWTSAEYAQEVLLGALTDYCFPDESVEVTGDTTYYALFEREQEGEPEKVLQLLIEEPDDWSGVYAIDGYDWGTYDDYLLSSDATPYNCYDNGLGVVYDGEGVGVITGDYEDLLFDIAKAADGDYTICSRKSGKYLAADSTAANGLTMVASAASEAAHWGLSFNEEWWYVGLTNKADTAKLLVFDEASSSFKLVTETLDNISRDDSGRNLALYRLDMVATFDYYFTTAPVAIPCAHQPVVDAAVPATCTEPGKAEGSHCALCNEILVAQADIAPLGHAWNDGEVTTPPTAVADGIKTFTCTRCDATKTEVIPKTGEWDNPFVDVANGKWYYSAVQFAVKNNLFNGTDTDTFSPEGNMTRGMLVTVLWRLDGKTAPKGNNPFSDVLNGKYYTEAVIWAAENDIVNGVGNGKFNPDGNVTREQMAAILYRYAGKKGYDTSKRADLSAYPDAGQISTFAKDALSWANAEGLINGSEGKLLPKGNATRSQVAAMLMRYMQNIVNK